MKMTEKHAENIISRYRTIRREDLIPVLQEICEAEGYLSRETIVKVARAAGLSTTKVFGLATFYDNFRFSPRGKVHLVICNGTTCYLNGSGALLARLKEELGIEPGETTRDGLFSYEISNCMGNCYSGPLVIINGEYYLKVKPDKLVSLINSIKKQQQTL